MKALILTSLLGLALFAVPAAVPASQPSDITLEDLRPARPVVMAPATSVALMTRDARSDDGIVFKLPTPVITHDFLSADPFAH